MSVSRKTRNLLVARAMGYCEVGGEPIGDEFAVHHRQLRSHGGSDRVENLLLVCHHHHNLGTNSIHLKVARAHTAGWIVPEGSDPATTLARIHGRWWTYLGTDGSYFQPHPELAEMVAILGPTRSAS